MYAPVGDNSSNQQPSLLEAWWPAGGTVGHGSKTQEKSALEGESERGGEGHGVGQKGDIMDSNQQQFCLKWNSFGSNLATAFSNLFKSESLTDVTLFCQGVTFKAHRLILAACSKHFQELFEGMPATPAGLIVILDGMSAQNMASLLEFMYRGEVHVSQESLSSFLKAAECLQVKGLSIEHEKLAVAQRHAAETKSADSGVAEPVVNNIAETAETPGTPELPQGNHIKRTPTPAPSPAPTYPLPSAYHTAQYYDNPQKKLLSRSPSDIDSLRRASVLRDGAAFRPASAPHPLLLENPYQPFVHHPDTPAHPHTAPHTPTDLKREFARDSSTERENGDLKENVAEDLRIKQEPFSISDRERAEKLAESLSREVYANNQSRYDSRNYGNNTDHAHHGAQLAPGMANLPPAHPPTPELSPAMWNSKINKAGTVTTPDGKKLKCPFCDRLYGYETNLRAHIRQRHQGIRVPCPFCSRTFTRNNTVRRHIAREHKTELSLKTFHQQAGHTVTDAVPQ